MTADEPKFQGDNEVLQLLRQIAEHLAAIRNGDRTAKGQWLTVDNVADELHVSRDSVERMISAGRLRAAELTTSAGRGARRRYRIRREWMEAFLVASTHSARNHVGERHRRPESRAKIDFID